MKGKHVCSAVLLFAVIILGSLPVKAATLFGKVIEVLDGDVIRVFNLNRPVRVRLIGLDAPEATQTFGDVARQHLSDLVLEKNVVVEYSGLGHDGAIVGRVLINDADMNAQMIRDGAAWYDPSYKNQLGVSQQEIYFQSEQAARGEKRGLWQSDGAIAPWEYVKNEKTKRETVASLLRSTSRRADRSTPELTSESLISTRSSSAPSRPADGATGNTWERFQPQGENFSALVPSGGRTSREPVPFGDQTIDVNYYMVRDGVSVYALMWTTGPTLGETDSSVIHNALTGFLRGVGAGYESIGGKFSCEPQAETDISSGGYSGKNFSLQGCTIPAVARVFTRASGGKRQLYLGAVFHMGNDANVDRFMDSFSVTSVSAPTKNVRKAAN